MRKVILLGFIACSGSACFGRVIAVPEKGFVMAGDAEGIRAYGETQNGIITNTKASNDSKSSYWQHREMESKEVTQREISSDNSGFWQKLVSGGAQ